MFLQKSPVHNHTTTSTTPLRQSMLNFSKQKSKQEKSLKLSNLRQLYTSGSFDWHKPLEAFVSDLQKNGNHYSMLVTLFEIAQEPLWRNKVPHLCSLIKILHNDCACEKGSYLSEISNIPDYHHRLCRVFYLNDNLLQEHFKLLIMLYLSYNSKEAILDEREISLGLLHAGRNRSDNRLPEYLWVVSQLKVDSRGIFKLLKYGVEVISQTQQQNLELATQTLIPVITSLSNYICYENDLSFHTQLMDSELFQQLLMHCLTQPVNYDLKQQSVLLCNNLLAKSAELAKKILSCQQILNSLDKIEGQQKQIWRRSLSICRQELGQYRIIN